LSARELIQVPKLGPLDIEPEDWRMLVRHVKAFSKEFEQVKWNPDAPTGEKLFFLDTLFAVTRSNGNHRIFLLPTSWRGDEAIPNFIKGFQSIVAFGIVKAMSNINRANAESKKLTLDDTQVKKKYNELVYSLEPDTEDVKLSVLLDKAIGKPIYYIIMNVKFEYEIYKTPLENLYGILQPVEEESEPPAVKKD
jgi:hypothetical protein